MRVQIPAYTDHWMRGDRYGDALKIDTLLTPEGDIERVTVRLDISRKIARFVLDDCKVV